MFLQEGKDEISKDLKDVQNQPESSLSKNQKKKMLKAAKQPDEKGSGHVSYVFEAQKTKGFIIHNFHCHKKKKNF